MCLHARTCVVRAVRVPVRVNLYTHTHTHTRHVTSDEFDAWVNPANMVSPNPPAKM